MKQKEGFTLFELLIAIFVGTTLIMAGAYAIRVGIFAMEKDEMWFNNSTKEKAAFDFFWQQVSSLRIQKIPEKNPELTNESKDKKKKKTIYFTGEKNLLSFVTPLSLKEHFSRGLVIATYEIKTNEKGLYDLYYSETIVNPKILATLSDETERRLGLDNIKEFTVFLRDYDRISIVYLDDKEEVDDETAAAATEDNESIPRKMTSNTDTILDPDVIEGTHLKWKEKIHAKIPLSIKLLVSKNGKEQELMSPIMAMYSYFAYGQ